MALACLDPTDSGQLLRIAELYLTLGSLRKAQTFLNRARKQAAGDERKRLLEQQIDVLFRTS